MVTLLPVLWLSLASFSLMAQPKKPSSFKLEDPELYSAFFHAHTVADLKIQASTPVTAAQISSSTAALYGMNAIDFQQLTAEVRKYNANLGAWFLNEQYYLSQQRFAKKLPDMKTLVNYQRQRQRLVMSAHGRIHGALSSAGWTGLYGYINGSFKAGLNQAKVAAK
jgi:hypothetical protein